MLELASSPSGSLKLACYSVTAAAARSQGQTATRQHPFDLLPCIDGDLTWVETIERKGARFHYLDPDLSLDDPSGAAGKDKLLAYLARTTKIRSPPTPAGRRLVEPGVGRTYLLDGLSLTSDREFKHFSATGIGLTPFSASGYVAIGRHLDGQVALKRAMLRRSNAERLEKVHVRAGKVVAIIVLPDQWVRMLDGSRSEAVIIVRAFRSLFRVKQLDPIAAFYHSGPHSARVASILLDRGVETLSRSWRKGTAHFVKAVGELAAALEGHCAAADDFPKLVSHEPKAGSGEGAMAREIRLELLRAYAPHLFRSEGRPKRETDTIEDDVSEYLHDFATLFGAQLARMRDARFLHDYHHPGVSRYTPTWLYTLVENNITLAAEFADLETGLFVDDRDQAMELLQLSSADVRVLQENFGTCHLKDVRMAKRVLLSLLSAAVHSGLIAKSCSSEIARKFDETYART